MPRSMNATDFGDSGVFKLDRLFREGSIDLSLPHWTEHSVLDNVGRFCDRVLELYAETE